MEKLKNLFTILGKHSKDLKKCWIYLIFASLFQAFAYFTVVPIFLTINSKNYEAVLPWLITLSFSVFLSLLFQWRANAYDYEGTSVKVFSDISHRLGAHMKKIPLEILASKRSGEIKHILASNLFESTGYLYTLSDMILKAFFIPIFVGILIMFYNFVLGFVIFIIFALVIPIYAVLRKSLHKYTGAKHEAESKMTGDLVEYIQGLPILKSVGFVDDYKFKLNSSIKDVKTVQEKELFSQSLPNLFLNTVVELFSLLIIAITLLYVMSGDLNIVALGAILVITLRFAGPVGMFFSIMSVVDMVLAANKIVLDFLNTKPLEVAKPIGKPKEFDIKFENLSFKYLNSDETVLKDINLEIKNRSMTAIVGPSGCGKTTLIKMILRYSDPFKGSVKIGGVDVKNMEQEELAKLVSVVFQDVFLFNDTIMNNIKMSNENISDEMVYEASKAAECHDFITSLPNGYETTIEDMGSNLSGGEKQRISIARAFLKDAPIIILDEPTAALDTENETLVQKAIDKLVKNKTVIVIAHRLSTIKGADKIVVLENGTIFEEGKHSELVKKESSLYKKLWDFLADKEKLDLVKS